MTKRRWWQSIRWRLALGSMLVALVATALLALAALLAIIHFYGADQQSRLTNIATVSAQNIGTNYAQAKNNLRLTVVTVFPHAQYGNFSNTGYIRTAQGEDYLMFVLYPTGLPAYPTFRTLNLHSQTALLLASVVNVNKYPNASNPDVAKLREAILAAREGTSTIGEIGQRQPVNRPFIVMPITAGGQNGGSVIGVLVMMPRFAAENTVPPFIASVGQAVLLASILVALVAAVAAILFSRTITRPLARLTSAARELAAGDYSVQVQTQAQGELGELAHSFNEMAAELKRDVEELHKQELWRRELIMSITHDLATPLTAIAGLGESLVDGVNQSREDYEATGRIIARETLRLRRLVKDLHVMAKVEAGALQPQRQPVRLAALVDEVLAVLATEFERGQVEPRNALPYNLLVQADPDMLTRVFSNLCDNALRHTPAGGVVTIEAQPRGSLLAISVVDTGEGIPAEALARIFERFYRADSARQSATGGSGLGLAIVRAIVEAHGGTVWAENVQGGGARIAFTLPLQAADMPALPDATTHPLTLQL